MWFARNKPLPPSNLTRNCSGRNESRLCPCRAVRQNPPRQNQKRLLPAQRPNRLANRHPAPPAACSKPNAGRRNGGSNRSGAAELGSAGILAGEFHRTGPRRQGCRRSQGLPPLIHSLEDKIFI